MKTTKKFAESKTEDQFLIATDEQKKIAKNLIRNTALLKKNSVNENYQITGILADNLLEGFHNLLLIESNLHFQDWGATMYKFQDFLYNILILLGKPGIVELLPEIYQQDASEMVGKLIDFFDWVDTDNTLMLLDFERLDYYPANKEVERNITMYSTEAN